MKYISAMGDIFLFIMIFMIEFEFYFGPDEDNHAHQCNPNDDEYWHSRDAGSQDDEDLLFYELCCNHT